MFTSERQYFNSEIEDFKVRDPAEFSVEELLHSMIKSFMDSVVTNINVRTDGQGCCSVEG